MCCNSTLHQSSVHRHIFKLKILYIVIVEFPFPELHVDIFQGDVSDFGLARVAADDAEGLEIARDAGNGHIADDGLGRGLAFEVEVFYLL